MNNYIKQHNNSFKTLAGIVLFNPDIELLQENINSIIPQVDELILVDNNSDNLSNIEILYPTLKIIKNSENLGVAKALLQILDYANINDYRWVLTLDQDSICNTNLISTYNKYLDLNKVAVLTCILHDRKHKLSDMTLYSDFKSIDSCITSGSFINLEAYNNSDGIDENLFIDWVDNDLCYNLKCHNYNIYRINFPGLQTEIASGYDAFIFGKKLFINDYPPIRRYYRCRNEIIIKKRYPQYYNSAPFIVNFISSSLCIIIFEKNKLKKILAILKGHKDAKKYLKKHKDCRQKYADYKHKKKAVRISY